MPKPIVTYVKYVDAVNRFFGRLAMYMIFAMLGVLLYSSISKTFFVPAMWTLEVAQFLMAAYYLLGGGYSMQLHAHVRMDLLYGRWSRQAMALPDTLTAFCLIFYLVLLLYRRVLEHRIRARIRRDELFLVVALHGADQDRDDVRHRADAVAGDRHFLPRPGWPRGAAVDGSPSRRRAGTGVMSYELIATADVLADDADAADRAAGVRRHRFRGRRRRAVPVGRPAAPRWRSARP